MVVVKGRSDNRDVAGQRDSLAEEVGSAKARTKELEGEKMALEGQVMNLKDKLADMDRLSAEFDEVSKARLDLGEQVRDLSSRLEALLHEPRG